MKVEVDSIITKYLTDSQIPKDLLVDDGLCLVLGAPGTGKSFFLNNLRDSWLMDGYKGFSIDFENSANKLVSCENKRVIDFSNKDEFQKLELFNFRPQSGEVFEKNELNKEGLPIYRFKLLREILKTFSLDCYDGETRAYISSKVDGLLDEAISLTYLDFHKSNPSIDDFIINLRLIGKSHLLANNLAQNLELFIERSDFYSWFSGQSEDEEHLDANYTVFNIPYSTSPIIKLVAKAAFVVYLDRFNRRNFCVDKFVDIDAINELYQDPILNLVGEIVTNPCISKGKGRNVFKSKGKQVLTLVCQHWGDYFYSGLCKLLNYPKYSSYVFAGTNPIEKSLYGLNQEQRKVIKNLTMGNRYFSECLYTNKNTILSIPRGSNLSNQR